MLAFRPRLAQAISGALRPAFSTMPLCIQPFQKAPVSILPNTIVRAINTSTVLRQADIPQNLQLADASILTRREPEVVIETYEQLFPLLSVPKSIEVKNFNNASAGVVAQADLEKTIFDVAIRKDIVLNLVRYIRNARRQPKKTKRMSEIRGSNKKPRPQKGSGTGQVGHQRNSAWRGGQKAHGPVLRDYSISMNKKQRALGMMMILAAKHREGNLHVFENFNLESHRTKEFKNCLVQHGLVDNLTMLVDESLSDNLEKASSNLPKLNAISLHFIDGYELLRKEKLAISASAFQALQARLLYQYTQSGKRKAMQRQSAAYMELVKQGQEIKSSA